MKLASILFIAVFVIIASTCHSQTNANYDFESLTLGSSIHGQDNWIVQSSFSTVNNGNVCPPAFGTELPPNIITSTGSGSYTSSQVLTAHGKGNQHAFSSRVNDGNWSIPGFTGAEGIIIEADWKGNWWGKKFRVAYDSNSDGDFSTTCTTTDANEVSFGFSTTQGNLRLHGANGSVIATGTRPSEWCRIRLCIDVLANSGQGAGSIFYLDHGSSGSWLAHSISNINMGFNTGASNQTNYQNINGMLYDQEAGGASIFDNISFDVYYSNSPGCIVALPISLISFSATSNDDYEVDLNWSTASEQNNDYFTIEKSIDGFDWKEVKIIDGAGNSETELHYIDVDSEPFIGTSFYRLKQTDYDGNFTYSNMDAVNLIRVDDIEIIPNPINGIFTILFSNKVENSTIIITDVSGKLVQSINIVNQHSVALDIIGNSGVYFVTIITGDQKIIKRVIKN